MGNPSPLAPGLVGSVGVPHSGVLTDPAELPATGAGFRRFREHGDANFALPRLVKGIERAARGLLETDPRGPRLVVGDLSVKTGGKIPRHNSHRTGRDVDFLLFLETPDGVPIESPGFVALGADGLARLPDGRYVRLDVEQEWHFVSQLLRDADLGVQFLFVSRDLEALLIQYAFARETDLNLVWHAETVMIEPADSLPHTDHIHMRIACSPSDAVRGCSGGGPHWPWLSELPELALAGPEILALAQGDEPPPQVTDFLPPDPGPSAALAPDGRCAETMTHE
jgi:penicillin-insensitive murein DD-endopeptidase